MALNQTHGAIFYDGLGGFVSPLASQSVFGSSYLTDEHTARFRAASLACSSTGTYSLASVGFTAGYCQDIE
jgi:hypothetical protein